VFFSRKSKKSEYEQQMEQYEADISSLWNQMDEESKELVVEDLNKRGREYWFDDNAQCSGCHATFRAKVVWEKGCCPNCQSISFINPPICLKIQFTPTRRRSVEDRLDSYFQGSKGVELLRKFQKTQGAKTLFDNCTYNGGFLNGAPRQLMQV